LGLQLLYLQCLTNPKGPENKRIVKSLLDSKHILILDPFSDIDGNEPPLDTIDGAITLPNQCHRLFCGNGEISAQIDNIFWLSVPHCQLTKLENKF
jgi:hypothetical protein